MRAAVLYAPGPPEAFRIEEIPVPAIGPDEALIRVAACGIAYHDIVERNGTYRRDMHFPAVLGYEIAGTVEAVGSAVTGVRPGDRICTKAFASCGACRYCRSGRETTCRSRRPVRGGYGEFTAIPADALVPIPDSLSFERACILGPGAGVALNAVRDTARVTIGDTVLVTGASGGVGLPAIRLAAMAGGRVIAVTRGAAKRQALLDAGAAKVLLWDGIENFGKRAAAMTGGEGVDVVIDTVGSAVFASAFAALAPHGRYAFVGQLSADEISINPARIFFKRAQLFGVGSVSRVQLRDVVALAAAGQLPAPIDRTLPLTEIAEAHRLVEAGQATGRIVLTL